MLWPEEAFAQNLEEDSQGELEGELKGKSPPTTPEKETRGTSPVPEETRESKRTEKNSARGNNIHLHLKEKLAKG
jgi:hypothetical protein